MPEIARVLKQWPTAGTYRTLVQLLLLTGQIFGTLNAILAHNTNFTLEHAGLLQLPADRTRFTPLSKCGQKIIWPA